MKNQNQKTLKKISPKINIEVGEYEEILDTEIKLNPVKEIISNPIKIIKKNKIKDTSISLF